MEIFTEEKDGIITLFISGKLSSESISNFDEVTLDQIKKKPEVIALDCIDFQHMDSYGIHHVFQFAKKASENDIELVAFNLNPNVKKLLEITSLNTFIKIVSKETFETDYLHLSGD